MGEDAGFLMNSNYCVRCYTREDKTKTPAEMIFKGASCCMKCVDEMLELMDKHEQEMIKAQEKKNSRIVTPKGGGAFGN